MVSADAFETLTGLVADVGSRVDPSHRIRPVSHLDPGEWDLRRFFWKRSSRANLARLDDWWVSEQYTGPTWDLLAECAMNGNPGILIVEAKAHHQVLQSRESCSRRTQANSQMPITSGSLNR